MTAIIPFISTFVFVLGYFPACYHALIAPARVQHVHRHAAGMKRRKTNLHSESVVSFSSPLIEEGYPPAVRELNEGTLSTKPLLIYLPGFDGTLLAPFLQLPELGTEFDVKGLTIDMSDRSSVQELRDLVIDFISIEVQKQANQNGPDNTPRPVYVVGESFGGILAIQVALAIKEINATKKYPETLNLQGITIINPATSFDRSSLLRMGREVTNVPPLFYPFCLLRLLPLFTDKYALPQLLLILQSKGLPSVIDNAEREAYMGRMAFSLPSKLKFMPQETLRHRLEEWLAKGCQLASDREADLEELDIPFLIVAGEVDKTLPSVEEANRLSKLLKNSTIHIVDGAGHGSTSGCRVDLTALMRDTFDLESNGRKEMKKTAAKNLGVYFGLEDRYDGASIGLSPLLYWSEEYYRGA